MSPWPITLRRLLSPSLTEPAPAPSPAGLEALAATVEAAARRRLGRSLALRAVDAGSCNGCELELHALANAFHDLERLGLKFVASPRHADVLLVTGPLSTNMRAAVYRAIEATPDPKWIVAVGDCAAGRGPFAGAYGVAGPLSAFTPVDLVIPGCPPTPADLLAGLRCLLEG